MTDLRDTFEYEMWHESNKEIYNELSRPCKDRDIFMIKLALLRIMEKLEMHEDSRER